MAGSKTSVGAAGGKKSVVKRVGSGAFRVVGGLTASTRPDPDFLLIGTKRGGTTSLYYDILKLPQVVTLFPSARYLPKANETKGIHFFDSHYHRGERWYRSYLPSRASRARAEKSLDKPVVVGEASPYYLFHPLAAERASRMVPNAKLILLLRDPVMRTYSHWKERRRSDAEPLDFLDALEAEPSRLAGEEQKLIDDPRYYSYAHEQQSYSEQSHYFPSIMRWVELYGIENVLVIASEDYYSDPATALAQVAAFLGIEYSPLASAEHLNAAQGEPLDNEIIDMLKPRFAADNAALETLIGRKLPWL